MKQARIYTEKLNRKSPKAYRLTGTQFFVLNTAPSAPGGALIDESNDGHGEHRVGLREGPTAFLRLK